MKQPLQQLRRPTRKSGSCETVYIEIKNRNAIMRFPVAPPGAMMSISFESEEIILKKLRERLRRMTDEELIKFGKDVRRLAENPFQKQLEIAREEWKRRRGNQK
jgi:hypothetical protein